MFPGRRQQQQRRSDGCRVTVTGRIYDSRGLVRIVAGCEVACSACDKWMTNLAATDRGTPPLKTIYTLILLLFSVSVQDTMCQKWRNVLTSNSGPQQYSFMPRGKRQEIVISLRRFDLWYNSNKPGQDFWLVRSQWVLFNVSRHSRYTVTQNCVRIPKSHVCVCMKKIRPLIGWSCQQQRGVAMEVLEPSESHDTHNPPWLHLCCWLYLLRYVNLHQILKAHEIARTPILFMHACIHSFIH